MVDRPLCVINAGRLKSNWSWDLLPARSPSPPSLLRECPSAPGPACFLPMSFFHDETYASPLFELFYLSELSPASAELAPEHESGKIVVSSRHLKGSIGLMAQQCEICGKKPQSGNRISHAHNVTKRRWNVNLRNVHARVGATTKRMRVCASCLRSGKVVKA